MKRKILAVLLSIFYFAGYSQQNVGIGTNNPGSKLQVSGSLAAGWANQTTTPYTLGTNDYYDAWSGTANGTFNLPAAINGAGNFVGRIYILKNATGAYTLTVQANGGEKIDGAAAITVQPGNSVTLISNGSTGAVTTWNVVSSTPSSGSATGWSTGGNAGTTPSSSPIGTAVNNNFAGTTDAKDFVVATNNLERMRLTSGGNLGIGTTLPSAQLHATGTVRFGNYPSGIISTDASGNLQTVAIGGSANQIDVTNGNGAANPAVAIDPAYTAEIKSQAIMTGGGTVTYSGGNLSWSTRFIVINNGTGSQFSTSGYFDIYQPPNGTVIPGVGSAASVTVNASGVPVGCWDALYYIMPVGSNNGTVNSNFRIAQYAAGFVVPESWILIANNNCDDGSLRLGTGITLTAGQSSNNGSGAYIDNGTVAQSANYNITGAGTVGGNLSAGGTLSVGGTSYFGGYITGMNGIYPPNNMVRLTPNLHFNSGQHAAVIMNWDNGNSGADLNFRVGNGAGSDVFDVLANGTVGINTTAPGYTLDLNGGTFGFGAGNVRTEQRLDAGLQGNAGAQSGFFQNDGSTVTDYPAGASGWWHLIDCRHSNGANNYAMQFANSFGDQNLYFRETNNNAAQPWSRVMTSNDVTGTTNYISKFTSANTIGNSQVYDDGSHVGIGLAPAYQKLTVNGNTTIGNGATYGTGSPGLAVGQNSDFPGNGGWPFNWNSNLLLIGNPDATITFAHETNSLANIRYSNGVFYVGDNAGWGDKILQTPTNTYLAINSGSAGIGTTAPNGKLDVYNSGANGDGAVFAPDIDLDNNFTIQTYIDAAAGGGWANRTTYAGTCCNNLALQPDVGTVSIGGTSGNYGSNKLNVLGQSYFSGYVGLNTTAPNRRLDIASGTGDGITFGQTQDNTETIQTYIDGQWSNRSTYASGCCNVLAIQPDVGQVVIGAMGATAKFEINLSNPQGWSGNLKATRVFAPDNGYYLDMNTYIVAGGNVGYQFSPNGNTGMVITTPGLVGIGTTTPGYNLDVNGNLHTSASTSDGGYTTLNALIEETNGVNPGIGLRYVPGGSTGAVLFGNGGSNGLNVGNMASWGGYGPVYASGFTVTSDLTMKKDIQYLGSNDFDACLEQIRNTKSIRFRYKTESQTPEDKMQYRPQLHLGVAAQSLPAEVVDSVQELPSGASHATKLGMSLPDMNGLLLAGVKALDNHQQTTDEIIKSQQQQIDELKKEIEELKEKK